MIHLMPALAPTHTPASRRPATARRACTALLAGCAAWLPPAAALATHEPPPPAAPASAADPTEIERLTRELQAAATRRPPVSPTADPRLVPASPESGRASSRLLREGTILVARRGTVSANDRGELVIVFEPDAAGRREPPMVLLPSQSAAQVARLREREGGSATVLVSGQVTAYHGRNYLLLTRPAEAVRRVTPPTPPTPPEPAPPAPPAPPTPPAPRAGDPPKPAAPPTDPRDPDQLMAQLEQAAQSAASSAAGGPGLALGRLPAGADEAPAGEASAREGQFITSRRGRMVRTTSGAWSLVFDTAPGAKGDAPLELMPSVNLMAMEDLALRGGEGLSLVVSGPVYSQGGRSFLLPTLYVVQPRTTR